MRLIEWAPGALDDLDQIADYVARDNERAAEALRQRIEESVLPAATHPYMFRAGRVAGTREIVRTRITSSSIASSWTGSG